MFGIQDAAVTEQVVVITQVYWRAGRRKSARSGSVLMGTPHPSTEFRQGVEEYFLGGGGERVK